MRSFTRNLEKENIKVMYIPAFCIDNDEGKIKTFPINPLMADHGQLNCEYFSASAKVIYTQG